MNVFSLLSFSFFFSFNWFGQGAAPYGFLNDSTVGDELSGEDPPYAMLYLSVGRRGCELVKDTLLGDFGGLD